MENKENYTFRDAFYNLPLRKGVKVIAHKIGETTYELYKSIEDDVYSEMCMPVLSLKNCREWLESEQVHYPQAEYLFINVVDNDQPRNENDYLSVTVALLDKHKKVIPAKYNSQGQEIVCRVIPCGTVDNSLIKILNGEKSVNIKL